MKLTTSLLTLLAVAVLAPVVNAANEAFTDPVGFVSVTVPAQSDAVLAVPLYRAPEFRGIIQSISGNTITVAGTPAWNDDQFVQALPGQTKTYAVLIAGGAKEGMFARVTDNGTATVTVQLAAGDNLTGIGTLAALVDPDGAGPLPPQADQIDIVPYWTPASLITGVPVGTEYLGFANPLSGVNLAAGQNYGYAGLVGGLPFWEDQETQEEASHTALDFGAGFVLRNNSGAPVTITMLGSVPMSAHRGIFRTLANNKDQDIRFGYLSPVPESIIDLNIPAVAGDAIFAFNNSATGKNKAAFKVYAYDGAQWVDDETGDPIDANVKLEPGFGYLYRKFRTVAPAAVTWQALQSYLQ